MIKNSDIEKYNDSTRILIQEKDVCLYVLPHVSLISYISNYTITFPWSTIEFTEDYTVLPHASATLVVAVEENDISIELSGPATIPDVVGSRSMKKDLLVIIEFQPAGLFALTGISQKELTDKTLPLDMIDPILNKIFQEIVEKNENIEKLIFELDKVFCQSFKYHQTPEMRRVVHEIIKYSGALPVKQLSEKLHYSERQLGRIFNQHIGTSPKLFSRLVKINKTLRLLRDDTKSVEMISVLAHYHDSSHFVKDFKSVCGITPQEFRLKMSDFYNEINKF